MKNLAKNLRNWLQRFGSDMNAKAVEHEDNRIVYDILDRSTTIEALPALIDAINGEKPQCALDETAIGIDASAFLLLAAHKRSDAIIDYLGSKHSAPLILPGQAIQEFWNNQLSAVNTLSTNITRKLSELEKEIAKLGEEHSERLEDPKRALEDIRTSIALVYDQKNVRATASFIEILAKRADVSFVPREMFFVLAQQRKRSKTPPGFKDEGDGDFYVWADFLAGIVRAKRTGIAFNKSVFVTLDKKPDWSRERIAHPILAAEARAAGKKPFELWNLDRLAEEVDLST